MSPRSQEFYDQARARLRAARKNVDGEEYTVAVGVAYYAMLYAARAVLSERDLHARTPRGTWHLVRQALVSDGSVPADIVSAAERLAQLREAADYDAAIVDRAQAADAVDLAERFLAQIHELLGG